MNTYINDYIKQATAFFPIVGKEEKAYLAHLEHTIEEYFTDSGPESVEDIVAAFKMPQNVVRDYLSTLDTNQIIKRIRMRNGVRFFVLTLLIIGIMWAIVTGLRAYYLMNFQEQIEGYVPPVYSDDYKQEHNIPDTPIEDISD